MMKDLNFKDLNGKEIYLFNKKKDKAQNHDIKTTISFLRFIENQDFHEVKKTLEKENIKEQTLSSGLVKALEVFNDKNNTQSIEIINELIK